MSKLQFIRDILNKYDINDDLGLLPIKVIDTIYDVYANNIVDHTKMVETCAYYTGIYFDFICVDTKQAINYYSIAITDGVVNAMRRLGDLYMKQDKSVQAVQLYKNAAEQGCIDAMYQLADYYDSLGEVGEVMKYLSMAFNCTVTCKEEFDTYYAQKIKRKIQKYIILDDIIMLMFEWLLEDKRLKDNLEKINREFNDLYNKSAT